MYQKIKICVFLSERIVIIFVMDAPRPYDNVNDRTLDNTQLANLIPHIKPFSDLINLLGENADEDLIDDLEVMTGQFRPGDTFSNIVYTHAKDNRYIALKMVYLNPRNIDLIKKEAEILRRYFKEQPIHPNLLKFIDVYNFGIYDGNNNMIVLVSEALTPESKNLWELMDKNFITGDINNPQFEYLFHAVLDIVRALHAQSIAHGDIWARNIVLDMDKNRLLLVDMGEACIFDNSKKNPEHIMCKAGIRRPHVDYSPPHILIKQDQQGVGSLTPSELKDLDVYALAATMYELFSRNHDPLIPINMYRGMLDAETPKTERDKIKKRFIEDLKTKIEYLREGEEEEKPAFQRLIIRLLKNKDFRNAIMPGDYSQLDLSQLKLPGETTPERGKQKREQFKRSWGVRDRFFEERNPGRADPDELLEQLQAGLNLEGEYEGEGDIAMNIGARGDGDFEDRYGPVGFDPDEEEGGLF
jgi:serine/threonine protein kinase